MFLAKAVAFALDVPFAASDSTGLSKTGQGNVFFDLFTAADFDLELAQRGVVFVAGMERAEAQDAIQRLWEKNVSNLVHDLTIQVGGLLFVCGASFAGVDDADDCLARNPDKPISAESLRAVGVRPEWLAAFAAVAHVPPFDEESLARIVAWVDFRGASQCRAELMKD